MRIFKKKHTRNDWTAIVFQGDCVRLASIEQPAEGRPIVSLCQVYTLAGSSLENVLPSVGKALQKQQTNRVLLLSPAEYKLQSVDMPVADKNELKAAVRWRLKELVDYEIDNATIDIVTVPTNPDAPGINQTVFAASCQNAVIADRQREFQRAKVKLDAIDIPEMAQRNMAALFEPENRAVAVVFFDTTGGLLTITYGGELYLSRRTDVTLEQVTHANADTRVAAFEKVTLDMQRSFDHFERLYRHITVAKLMLMPLETADMLEHLKHGLYLPVEIIDLSSVLDLSNTPDLATVPQQQQNFHVLGAALRKSEVSA